MELTRNLNDSDDVTQRQYYKLVYSSDIAAKVVQNGFVPDETEVQALYKQIGASIAALRRRKDRSQESLAAEVQLTRTSVTNIEHGRQHVQIHTLYAIAAAFGVPLTDLLPAPSSLKELKKRQSVSLTNEEWLQQLNVSIPASGINNDQS